MNHAVQPHTATSAESPAEIKASLDQVIQQAGQVILGKDQELRLALACLLARGHLLIEDLPGVGKTTLAHCLAQTLGLDFQRVQFTSDLLPADILGTSIYDHPSGSFTFHPGPVFANVLLADEINRATPKTQSALLEAMEERQVTTGGETYPLPQPFFVLATQNPTHQVGTFPLPESQLDRFLMRLQLGYPAPAAERALLAGQDRRDLLADICPQLAPATLSRLQSRVPRIHVADALLDYLQALLAFTREAPYYHTGLSPRAGLALLRCSQAWALLAGRDHCLPEDLQAVLANVVTHRLQPAVEHREEPIEELVAHLLTVPIP